MLIIVNLKLVKRKIIYSSLVSVLNFKQWKTIADICNKHYNEEVDNKQNDEKESNIVNSKKINLKKRKHH